VPVRDPTVGAVGATAVVAAATGGDDAAFGALVDRHIGLVRAICEVQGVPPDAVAEVCGVVWLRLAEHLGRLARPDAVGEWIAATARFECQRVRLRTAARAHPASPHSTGVSTGPAREPDATALATSGGPEPGAPAPLDPVERHVLHLRAVLPQPSLAEVGAALALAPATVAEIERRGAARLRAHVRRGALRRLHVTTGEPAATPGPVPARAAGPGRAVDGSGAATPTCG